jgi:hypothetical protein
MRSDVSNAPYDEGVTILPGRPVRAPLRTYPGRVTDAPHDDAVAGDGNALRPEEAPEPGDVAAVNVVDEYRERAIDRFAQGSLGTAAGAGLIGLGKALGLHKETREAAEIREADEPEPDPDDPIHVNIDLQHPENTRIVYRLQPSDDEPTGR